ncbi:hypothetical protein BJV82DRAFT_590399 [Fennellomyces sp. T-0311]|nr:hypothetical protein BJV82DRAFT_590399 [Fennellomyces sp. T-0311]
MACFVMLIRATVQLPHSAAADRIGNLNAFIISMTIGTVAVLVNWMFARSFGALMTFAVLLGLAFGNFYTIMHTVTIAIVGQERYTPAIGLVWISFLIGIAGPVVASYVESSENVEPFFYCKIIAGAGYGACALLSLLLKFRLERRLFAKI